LEERHDLKERMKRMEHKQEKTDALLQKMDAMISNIVSRLSL